MARFRATGAIVIGAVKYPAGTVFADAPGSVQPGDSPVAALPTWAYQGQCRAQPTALGWGRTINDGLIEVCRGTVLGQLWR